ncbi:hypothetical protein LDG_6990 [Legionella drancourtii LLAP12]|uniref:Uncharacterized protein n=1 Tax=Legionella drancourtii LLAP12 TaxID=658187 RepID=G9EP10_9GAMM|nr:hypothetical protein LDG_6990 [Legionella drancourtii LLAP12]
MILYEYGAGRSHKEEEGLICAYLINALHKNVQDYNNTVR